MRHSSTYSLTVFGLALFLSAFLQPLHAAALTSTMVSVPTDVVAGGVMPDDTARPAAATPFYVTFALRSPNKAAIDSFVRSLTDPSSINFHKWITSAEFGQRYGAAVEDIRTVIQYASQCGFTNITVRPDRLFISAEGSRSTVESAFGIEIHG